MHGALSSKVGEGSGQGWQSQASLLPLALTQTLPLATLTQVRLR
jgi:hypothetical protein